MTVNEARSQVAKLNARFLESGLAVAVNSAIAFPDGQRVRVSWPSSRDAQGVFSDAAYASLSEYRTFFYGSHYTCLLKDGALVQVSYDFDDNEMVGHRYCFYPCPLILPEDMSGIDWDMWNDLLEEELFAEIEALKPLDQQTQLNQAAGMLRLRSPIRFDYDPEKQTASEPSSHVHLSGPEARIPVHAALTLSQFVHFVVTHFYPSHSDILASFSITYFDRCIQTQDEHRLHFDWRRHL